MSLFNCIMKVFNKIGVLFCINVSEIFCNYNKGYDFYGWLMLKLLFD